MDRRMTAFKWVGWEYHEIPPEVAEQFSDADNLSYAKAILVCAAGDGEISSQEREWLIGWLTTAGDSDEVIEAMQTYDGGDSIADLISASPLMRASGRSLVYDALRACASDGDLSAGERERIQDAAAQLGIPTDVVAELEQILNEEQGLRKRRHQLIVADALAAAQG